ncbi:MAG TPA: NnrS family protein, partial [Alphaproteobacteria bacterium]|nr:NnrS family protein [Alphaproteobacteria bacterium]
MASRSPIPEDVCAERGRFALWNLGFRPLYLAAGIFAAIAIAAWVAQLAGWTGSSMPVAGPSWHAHEMVFGYAAPVIVGFLFTAVRNWTGRPTPTGLSLAGIVGLWLAARLLVPTPWHTLAAAFDTAFLVAAAIGIGRPLVASGNRRNYFFIALLLGLGAVNAGFYLATAGEIDFDLSRAVQLGLDLVLFVMAVMGGRVIPMFTANAIAGSNPRRSRGVERVALGTVLALLAADLLGAPLVLIALVAAAAAAAHAARLALWRPLRTSGAPILWILHASYAWIVLHLALRAA